MSSTRLEALMDELDGYLTAGVKNQGLRPGGPTGTGTLRGFHAKVAEVFQLGRSVGYDECMSELEGSMDDMKRRMA
jgi:hypothetical protein